MALPRWIARLNARFTNRLVEPIVKRLMRGFVIVHHRGRRTSRRYRTPLLAFRRNGVRFVALMYGPGSDWVRNVLTGPALLEERDGTVASIVEAEVVPRRVGWDAIGLTSRIGLRTLRVGHLLRFETAPTSRSDGDPGSA